PVFVLFYYLPLTVRALHSFPTRRSSDLVVGQRRIQRRIDREVTGLSQHDRVPVGRRLCCKVDADVAAGAGLVVHHDDPFQRLGEDRKSTRLNSSHVSISYAVFCLKKKKK